MIGPDDPDLLQVIDDPQAVVDAIFDALPLARIRALARRNARRSWRSNVIDTRSACTLPRTRHAHARSPCMPSSPSRSPPPRNPRRARRRPDPHAARGPAASRPPLTETDDPSLEPQVTVRTEGEQTVQEYRVNGKLYMMRVTPKHGKPYILMDSRGDGTFTKQDNTLDTGRARAPVGACSSSETQADPHVGLHAGLRRRRARAPRALHAGRARDARGHRPGRREHQLLPHHHDGRSTCSRSSSTSRARTCRSTWGSWTTSRTTASPAPRRCGATTARCSPR